MTLHKDDVLDDGLVTETARVGHVGVDGSITYREETFRLRAHPPRLRWRFGGRSPEGYEWPDEAVAQGSPLTCSTCGAAVMVDAHRIHTEWHQRA